MQCLTCLRKAVYLDPAYCKEHFLAYVEETAYQTIKEYDLLNEEDRICVAVSGGKDSITVLDIVHKKFPNVVALAIDEGIANYRGTTLSDLKEFCEKRNINLRIVSIKEEFGHTLDELLRKGTLTPCTICGVMRRYLLNKYAQEYDKIVTGHNLDDEAQCILMNIFKGTVQMNARLGPMTGVKKHDRLVQRVKPLYFLKEKEITAYSFLKGYNIKYTQCPHAHKSFRGFMQKTLNDIENKKSGTKRAIVSNFIKDLPALKKHYLSDTSLLACSTCGEPARHEQCKTCSLVAQLKI